MRKPNAGRFWTALLALPLALSACSDGKGCEGGNCSGTSSSRGYSGSASPGSIGGDTISDAGYAKTQCSEQGPASGGGNFDAGETLTSSGRALFDGSKKSDLGAGASPVPAGSGKKCFSGFTAASARPGLRTRGVPDPRFPGVDAAFSRSRVRESKALSEVIPGGPIVMEKYLEFQKKAYDVAYGVLDRAGWGARRRNGSDIPQSPVRMTVHHTQGHRPMDEAGAAKQARYIQHYHMVGRRQEGKQPFDDIGYHFLIAGDGTVVQGRPSNVLGAHAHSANNGNIGISLMGDFNKIRPTGNQMESLKRLVAYTAVKYDINPKQSGALEGHSHYNPTDCPGRSLKAILAGLRVAAYEEMIAMHRRGRFAAESVTDARPITWPRRLFPYA